MTKGTCGTWAGILALTMALALAGCGSTGSSREAAGQSTSPAEQEDTLTGEDEEGAAEAEPAGERESEAAEPEAGEEAESGSSALVVYFSRTGEQYQVGVIDEGNTAIVARMIGEAAGADLFEILPADDHYPETYEELTEVAKDEQRENARPAYAGEVPDLSVYETIFIGSPVWWGDWPMIMYSFFEDHGEELSGKTLIPFSTHEGSGLSGFDKKLASACPDSTVGEGLAVRGYDAQNDREAVRSQVESWVFRLGF
jgi:flavodoxin